MKNFFRKFGFTSLETAVVITLLITFGIGLIIEYSGWKRPDNFDYSGPDKQFEEVTKLSFEQLKEQKLTELQQQKSDEIRRAADSLLLKKENAPKNDIKPGKKININNAYEADLMMLPGIGEVIADRIIDYREKNNGFKSAEELMKVKGIGEKKFEKIRDYIIIE
jgi:comEA protein